MPDFTTLRQRMVDNQIRPGSITDYEVLKAFLAVPREDFVAAAEKPFAYADRELRLPASGEARAMMPSLQLARMIQALPHGPEDKVLIVGCGTGYSAAILALMAGRVIGLEEDAALASIARSLLRPHANVAVTEGRLADGHAAEAPYDVVLIDGAVEIIPDALVDQLKPGGFLATIERDDRLSRAMLYERVGEQAMRRPLFDAWAWVLPGFQRKREFVF